MSEVIKPFEPEPPELPDQHQPSEPHPPPQGGQHNSNPLEAGVLTAVLPLAQDEPTLLGRLPNMRRSSQSGGAW